jgi:hypothetical protein
MVVSPSVAEIRAYVLKALREDLVGPHAEQECLGDRPTAEYLAGILYPSHRSPAEEERVLLCALQEDTRRGSMHRVEEEEEEIIRAQPTSQGLSCALVDGVKQLQVQVAYGIYRKGESPQTGGWQRRAYTKSISLDLDQPAGWRELEHGGWIYWTCAGKDGQRRVTVCLVNRQRWPDPQGVQQVDELCLFQPLVRLTGGEKAFAFVPLVSGRGLPEGPDRPANELFSRNRPAFAVGHGCAANWGHVQGERAHEVWIEQIPSYEQEATLTVEMAGLSMLALGKARGPADVIGLIEPVLIAYEQWIEARRQELPTLPEDMQGTAQIQLRGCTEALERMRAALALIQQNGQVFEAFRFANQAMLYQRSQRAWAQVLHQTGQRSREPSWEGAWRPFQLAFLLLNLVGIVDPEHAERELVDVVCLPAGSGKLEASLGLIAFTLGWRRLRGKRSGQEGDGGVTVILRAALCLPTQQFQRAAALICACEYVRRRDPRQRWGARPFQIGLWVGDGATPRHLKKAEEVLKRLSRGEEVCQENPCQLTCCPWCGEPLTASSYIIYRAPGVRGRIRLLVVCPRPACAFSLTKADLQQGRTEKSLPVVLVDEDIYHQCPSLLVTTMDSCVRLPWEPETGALFGRVNRFCPHHGYLCQTEDHSTRHQRQDGVQPCAPFLPPELIIQDGLHLLAGPQGTLASLYEAAIDQLSTSSGPTGRALRPKVVASTAPMSWTDERVKRLFAREGRLFPPAGFSMGDTFFTATRPLTQQPGRLYVGVSAPGRSVKAALVRVYALLLQIAGEQRERCGPGAAGAYTTLLGYCKSLQALQETMGLVEDEVVQRVRLLAERRGRAARQIQSGQNMAEILHCLELPPGDRRALDLLLVTQMILAGMESSHLDLLVLSGWPGSGAEYIQATSQVGRLPEAPGLVVTVFDWPRRCDLLHYECFRAYHQALSWHVEMPDLRPFAPEACDCALHAVLIAVARLQQEQWTANASASRFVSTHELVGKIRDGILARVKYIDPARADEVRQHLVALENWWQRMATEHGDALRYQQRAYRDDRHLPVLLHHAAEMHAGESLPTLSSLRDAGRDGRLLLSC